MALSDEDVREILRIIDESPLRELRIETEDFALHVLKDALSTPSDAPGLTEPARPGTVPQSDGLPTVDAPMLGTFYRAEGPSQKPFVEVGSVVEPDTIVCIIEVMKMMNSVPAGISGKVAEVLRENAQLVEYGEPLFRVQPS
jgi:acetyl-CoA carboxylase biotin carboxyl carrier protein